MSDNVTSAKAWNPRGLGWLAFLFSVFPAGVMYAVNWNRLGHPDRRTKAFVNLGFILILYYLVMAYLPDIQAELAIFVLNTGISIYFARRQRKSFRKFLKAGGKKAGWLVPIVSCLALTIVVPLLFVAYGVLTRTPEDKALKLAAYHVRSGSCEKAKDIYREMLEEDPENPLPYVMLFRCYQGQCELDSAQAQMERLLDVNPACYAGTRRLNAVLTYIIWKCNRRNRRTPDSIEVADAPVRPLTGQSIKVHKRIKCSNTPRNLNVFGSQIIVELQNGDVEVFDSVGQQVALLKCDLRGFNWNIGDTGVLVPYFGPNDWAGSVRHPSTVAIYRDGFEENHSAHELGPMWTDFKNNLKWAFGIGSHLELADLKTMKKVLDYKFKGWAYNTVVDESGETLVFIECDSYREYLRVLNIESGDVTYSERLPRTREHVFFAQDSLYVFGERLLHVYSVGERSEVVKTDVRWINQDFRATRSFFAKGPKGLEVRVYNDSVNATMGPVTFIANDSIHALCRDANRHPNYLSMYWIAGNNAGELIARQGDSLIVADFEVGTFEVYHIAEEAQELFKPYFSPLDNGRFVSICEDDEIVIFSWRRK